MKAFKIYDSKNFMIYRFNTYIGFSHNSKFSPWKWRQDIGFFKLVRK